MKTHKLINDDFQLVLKDQDGNQVRSIIHFGAFKERRESFFKGRKEILIKKEDFDELAELLCSRYRIKEEITIYV